LTTEAAAVWSGATYERIAETFAPIHDRVVAELSPGPGSRLLDLACGTGAMSLVAARVGADVVGIDISAEQLEKARDAAASADREIAFDEGDVQSLPYESASFDLAGSVFGLVFAPDHRRTAQELARVVRSGGRIAFTSWTYDEWSELGSRLGRVYPEGADARKWSLSEHAGGLLEDAFELERATGEWVVEAESGEKLWKLVSTSSPPLRAWLTRLDEDTHARAEAVYRAYLASGSLRRPFVLWLGRRR
jgi:SAM-dependent methyltransferase